MNMEKEKMMITRYEQALHHAACDFARTKTNCGKCRCKDSCGCNPGTLGCRFALEDKWKQDAGIKDNHDAGDAPTYAQEQLTDIERREAVNNPAYYKTGGIEAIDAIEAWGLGFHLGNVVKYIARAGRKTADGLQDLRKAAWYLDREIKRREHE